MKTKGAVICVLLGALVSAMFIGTPGCTIFGPKPIPPVIIDDDFIRIVEDALDMYIQDPNIAKAAKLILRLVVYIAKKINEAGDAAAAQALQDEATAIQVPENATPEEILAAFERAKALGKKAIFVAKAHVKKPS